MSAPWQPAHRAEYAGVFGGCCCCADRTEATTIRTQTPTAEASVRRMSPRFRFLLTRQAIPAAADCKDSLPKTDLTPIVEAGITSIRSVRVEHGFVVAPRFLTEIERRSSMRRFLTLLTLVVTLAGGSPAAGQSGAAKTLDIYHIDAEGGQSTLFVSPSGQVLLVDTGSGGDRDPARILEALKAAGVQKIDHMLLTHYHRDHYGGLPQIAKQIPITHFFDHGQPVEMDQSNVAAFANVYIDLVGNTPRTILKPGDK